MRRPHTALVLIGVLALVGGGTALASKGKSASTPTTSTTTTAPTHPSRGGPHGPSDDLQAAGDHGPGGPHGFGDHGSPAAAATYLGISRSALQTQLQAGKTLAQIANATSGKSAAGLIAALVADAKQHFGSSVPSDLEQRITELVNGVRPAFGPRGDQHDRGPFGPPPSGGSSA